MSPSVASTAAATQLDRFVEEAQGSSDSGATCGEVCKEREVKAEAQRRQAGCRGGQAGLGNSRCTHRAILQVHCGICRYALGQAGGP
jgi:hypothetical protein